MRRTTLIFLIFNLVLLGLAINAFSTLIGLLFEDGARDAIPSEELRLGVENTTVQMIPRIIHQTYINESIPERWKKGQQACVDLHPESEGWEYKLWTDATSRTFIQEHYASFLPTFDSYPYPIQRADAIRYFILHHHGGIYIDLDDGCARPLTPLLSYPAWLRRTIPTGISNDAMGSVPGHPFFEKTIAELKGYARSWGVGYITVMYSTGPLFLSVLWKEYLGSAVSTTEAGRLRVLMPSEYKGFEWSFFNISKGSSWHGKDAQTIFWMGKHWVLVTIIGFAVGGVLITGVWVLWGAWMGRGSPGSPRKTRSFWGKRRSAERGRYELVDRTV